MPLCICGMHTPDVRRLSGVEWSLERRREHRSNSSFVSGSGLACMLLARAAFSTTPGKSASVIPQCAQRRNVELGAKRAHPIDAVLGARVIPAGKQARDGGVALERGMLRRARSQCSDIGCHAMRQQRRAKRAVRRLPRASERRGEAMHHAQSGVGQREAAEETGQRHVAARVPVGAIVVRAAQRTGDAPDAVNTDCIYQRIGARADVGFDELREGVEAGEWQ